MSDSLEDAELSKLQRAAEFMRGVRLTQSGSTKLKGRNYLSSAQQQRITEAVDNSGLVAGIKESVQADWLINQLAERFEEMCRRQGVIIDKELRPDVVKLLASELWANQQALNMPAEKLVSGTLHQGAIAPQLLKEFPEFPRYAVMVAMTHAPAASREFLRRAAKEAEAMESEPEFQGLVGNRPGDFINAAVSMPGNPRAFLRKIVKETGHWATQEAEREGSKNPKTQR